MIYADLEYDDATTHRHALHADESKKSVYWLQHLPNHDSSSNSIKALVISADRQNAFFIGGFQLQGMAKIIKVYVDDVDKLVMSVRGIKSTRLQAFFKAQCVIPGGARPVVDFVRLELEPAAVIHQIRWTIRMRDNEDNSSSTMMMSPEEEESINDSSSQGVLQLDGMGSLNNNDPELLLSERSRGQDANVAEPLPTSSTSSSSILLQAAADALVEATSSTIATSTSCRANDPVEATSTGGESGAAVGGIPVPAVASLTQHMADLTAAMRELTATIKDHQRFLQEQQRPDT